MRRGFTIIELSFVLTVMGILIGATVPVYEVLVKRARAQEAWTTVQAIAQAELQYHRDHRGFLACEGATAIPKKPVQFPNGEVCWRALGIRLDGPCHYWSWTNQPGWLPPKSMNAKENQ